MSLGMWWLKENDIWLEPRDVEGSDTGHFVTDCEMSRYKESSGEGSWMPAGGVAQAAGTSSMVHVITTIYLERRASMSPFHYPLCQPLQVALRIAVGQHCQHLPSLIRMSTREFTRPLYTR